MAKFNFLQNALVGGEVTPLARGRSDAPQYKDSLEDCKNMIPFVAGGAARRQGSTYENKVGSSGGQLNLSNAVDKFIPWEMSDGKRYIVCLGGSSAIKVIDTATNALKTVTDASTGTFTHSARTMGTVTTTEAQTTQYCQIGDILVVTPGGTAPHFYLNNSGGSINMYGPWDEFLTRIGVGGSSQQISTAQKHQRAPFLPVNVSSITLASSVITLGDPTTVTASTSFFASTHVGTWFKFAQGSINITGFTNSTTVTGIVKDALTVGTATASWEESAWSDYQGWPRTVGFFKNRIVYGGSTRSPDTLWFSQDSDPQEMSLAIGGTPTDTDAFAVAPSDAERVSKINWMSTGNKFAFGTEREEFTVSVPDSQAGFSLTNIAINKQTSRGSKYIQAVRIESACYFVAADGQRIIEFVFDERENNYRNRDLNIFADHVFAKFQEEHSSPRAEKLILSMCKQSEKDQKLWVLDEAGGLFCCVLDRLFSTNAWSIHYLGGNGSGNDLDPAPFVRAFCSLENTGLPTAVTTGHDVLWLSTGRSINSSFTNYVEYIDQTAATEDDFLDFKKTVSQASSTTVTGLTYVAGETVKVVANGIYVGEKTVNGSGQMTLDIAATLIIVGFGYKSKIKTLPIEAGSQIGSALGSLQRIDQARVYFYRTANASFASAENYENDILEEVLFRPAATPTSDATPLFTGYKVLDFSNDYERGAQVIVETEGPLAMTITHVTLRGQTYD